MPAILRRTLVVLLALRAVAAPVVLQPTPPTFSHQQFLVVRMRCWPYQQLQRFSASSKLLQLYSGKNRGTSGDDLGKREYRSLRPESETLQAMPASTASTALTTGRLSVCLRC